MITHEAVEKYLIDNEYPVNDHNVNCVLNGDFDDLMDEDECANATLEMQEERAEYFEGWLS